MSEKLSTHEQTEEVTEKLEARQEAAVERADKKVEAVAKPAEVLKDHMEKIEEQVEAAKPKEAATIKEKLELPEEVPAVQAPDKTQKQQALRTYLGQVRHHLSGPDKSFSKFVHNPTVNTFSEKAGNTVVRPSGILTGSVFTLIGSGYYYYATKHTGYSYSFTVALILFIGGFLLGVLAEFVFKSLFRHREV